MSPKELIKNRVEAFNNKEAEKLASFYSENAVNHQVNSDPVKGREAVKKMFEAEFARAEMVCIIENIFEDGIWGMLEWKDPLGLRGCGFFHIQNDKIIFQRGYWDKLTFLKLHNKPLPNS